MDFNEYWKNGCFGEYHDIYAKNLADKFYQAGQQSKQAEIKKAVLSLRNEFNLWADDTEQFHAIEAQIEQLEDLLK